MSAVQASEIDHFERDAFKRWMITLAVMLVAVVEIIDMTIVNVSLPQMMGELGANSEQITWVLTTYIVASAIFMPLTGFLVTRFGRKQLLLVNILGFLVGSVACGLAKSLSMIIFFRAVQGSFGAGLVPLSQYILRDTYPRDQYGKAMAIWGIGIMTAPVIGPTLGGYLTEVISWRWIFFINIPICLLAIYMTLRFISESVKEAIYIDWLGMVLMAVGIATLQLFLDRGNVEDWFNSTTIWALGITWIATLSLFFIRGLGNKKNIIDFDMFRDRNFAIAEILMLLFSLCVIGLISIQPIMLENFMGYPSLQAGLIMAPGALANAMTLMTVNPLMQRTDPRYILIAGLMMVAFSSLLMSGNTTQTPKDVLMLYGVFQGVGMGLFFVPLATIAFSTISSEHAAASSGLFSFARSLGASMGIAMLSTFVNRHAQMHWNQLGEHVQSYNPNLTYWLTTRGFDHLSPSALGMMQSELMRQSGLKSFLDAFTLIMVLSLALIPLVFLLPKPTSEKNPESA